MPDSAFRHISYTYLPISGFSFLNALVATSFKPGKLLVGFSLKTAAYTHTIFSNHL